MRARKRKGTFYYQALFPVAVLLLAASSSTSWAEERCRDPSDDPAGCQPSTFDTPVDRIPGGRVDRSGRLDPFSKEKAAREGAFHAEKKEGLFRNFEHLHWAVTVPSVRDPETGEWADGDLEGRGDGRGLAIAGDCMYVGHRNGTGVFRGINIFRIQPDAERTPPVEIGEIDAFIDGNRGFDDRELRALLYTTTSGQERMLMIRDATTGSEGKMETFVIDPATCQPVAKSDTWDFGGQSHEFFLWHDPNNPNRVLAIVSMWSGAGRPDPNFPGTLIPDIMVFAVTDENTGEVLSRLRFLAGFKLEDVGGPLQREAPDATGLFADGRFSDFSHLTDSWGRAGGRTTSQNNQNHMVSVTNDGERFYAAHGTAGFYIIDSEAIAHSRNDDLAAGTAGCNQRSTNVWVGGTVGGENDVSKLGEVANDCLHMVVNDDVGVQALLASSISDQQKLLRYMQLLTRSRLDFHPPNPDFTGLHSAVYVPDRPSRSIDNTEDRPAYVWLTDEDNRCPLDGARIVAIDSEISPVLIGGFDVPDNYLEECLSQPNTEPDGTPKERRVGQQNHNPTVFKNLVFNTWYGHGLRAIDISRPSTPREVGHAINVPWSIARSYAIFKDGLIYWNGGAGVQVVKYTGPRADELPGPGSGVFEGNATSPHR